MGADGKLYGTTSRGGSDGSGSVFTVSTNGVLTTLYSFGGGDDGWSPDGRLCLGSDGNFYGTTSEAGSLDYGTLFKITTNGVLTTLYAFSGGGDSGYPLAGLTQGSDCDLYGTTDGVGGGDFGTVFKVTTEGALTTLGSFTGADQGAAPSASLVAGNDGNLYGTTLAGGAADFGTVFKITPGGVLTLLASFSGPDGAKPYARLTLGGDGSLYGTTTIGGIDGYGTDL